MRDDTSGRDLQERRLFMRLCEGDLTAFEAFCTRLEAPVYSYVTRLIRDASEAEDLAQEAFLRFYKLARDRKIRVTDGSPRALVFRIAHNLAMDHFRRARRNGTLEPLPPPASSRGVEQAWLREQILRALADIPEPHRAALMLREFGDLSYAEIADTLDATLDQVKVWIYRARKKLATLLDRDGQYLGTTDPQSAGTILPEQLGDFTHGG